MLVESDQGTDKQTRSPIELKNKKISLGFCFQKRFLGETWIYLLAVFLQYGPLYFSKAPIKQYFCVYLATSAPKGSEGRSQEGLNFELSYKSKPLFCLIFSANLGNHTSHVIFVTYHSVVAGGTHPIPHY